MVVRIPISDLPLADPMTANEAVPVLQNGVTKQTTAAALAGVAVVDEDFDTIAWEDALRAPSRRSVLDKLMVVDSAITALQGIPQPPTPPSSLSAWEQQVAVLPGLRRSLKFDEASGLVAADSSAVGGNGSYSVAGITYGVHDDVALVTSAPQTGVTLADALGVVTVPHEALFDLSTIGTQSWSVIVDLGKIPPRGDDLKYPTFFKKGDPNSNGLVLFFDPHYGTLALKIAGTEGAGVQIPVTGIDLTVMHMLTVIWDGPTFTIHFYVDAVEVHSEVIPSGNRRTVTTTAPLTIGGTASTDGAQTISKLVICAANVAPQLPALFEALHGPAIPPAGNGAKLVFADDFNGAVGSGINLTEWNNLTGSAPAPGWTVDQRVAWCPGDTSNVALDGAGNLVLTMRREVKNGYPFTSARVEHKRPWRVGYLEIKADAPTWPGAAPGLWTMGAVSLLFPSASLYDGSNDFIELDLLEVQTQVDPTNARQNIHGDFPDHLYNHPLWQLGWSLNKVNFAPNKPGDAFHTYGVWVDGVAGNPATKVVFYVDRVVRATYTPAGLQAAFPGAIWPYGIKPMVTILDIEVGGYSGYPADTVGGAPINSDTLKVDYVQLWDKPPF